ncbi:TPA: hypothetical protein ACKRE5_001513 [Proteus mirabilis]|nr:hypothetical protein [Providencia rettgeri]
MSEEITCSPVTGLFVLYAIDGEFTWDEDRNIVFESEGVPKIKNPYPTYFESGFDDNRARYWTRDINDAYVFGDLDRAVNMLIKTTKKCSPVFIRKLDNPSDD